MPRLVSFKVIQKQKKTFLISVHSSRSRCVTSLIKFSSTCNASSTKTFFINENNFVEEAENSSSKIIESIWKVCKRLSSRKSDSRAISLAGSEKPKNLNSQMQREKVVGSDCWRGTALWDVAKRRKRSWKLESFYTYTSIVGCVEQ